MGYRYYTADVFTNVAFGGNQLAVLPDARGLTDAQMLGITREFNYSETVFVFPPEAGGTRKLRIFTPSAEIPFAGHPTVGTAHVLAAIGEIPLRGAETHIVFEEGVGPVPVTIRAENNQPVFAQLSVAKLPEAGPQPPTRTTLAEILSLDASDIVGGTTQPQALSCGLPFLLVPVKNRDAVARARVRLDRWEEILKGWWAPDIMVFAKEAEHEGHDLRARVFVPSMSVPEDPATGSACATLAGYLAHRDARTDGTLRWVVEQGYEMGRPSTIEIEADKEGSQLQAIRVGGSSVLVAEGTMRV